MTLKQIKNGRDDAMMVGMMNIKMTIIKEVHLPRYERGSSFDVLPHRFAPDNERFQDQEITIIRPECLNLDLNQRTLQR